MPGDWTWSGIWLLGNWTMWGQASYCTYRMTLLPQCLPKVLGLLLRLLPSTFAALLFCQAAAFLHTGAVAFSAGTLRRPGGCADDWFARSALGPCLLETGMSSSLGSCLSADFHAQHRRI